MSYLVLARKWRPQTFEHMTGQEHVVRTLANAIAMDRVAHAFLFCGPRGVGKTTAARLLAKALNCENGPTATPCGTCRTCTEIAAGNSVDVVEIDGASNNGVENAREIRENAKYLPQKDRHKVYIIDEVHMLSTSAFNALLKTLEEPPGHVKFIFATTEVHKVPDTILSRCQRHNFRRISTQTMQARLKEIASAEGLKISDSALVQVVGQAEGGMRDALSLLDQVLAACGTTPSDEDVAEALGTVDRRAVYDFVEGLVRRDAGRLLKRLDEMFTRGVDLTRLAAEVCSGLRHLFVTRALGEAPAELPDTERTAFTALSREADPAQVTRLFDAMMAAVRDVGQAPQPKLALEMAVLKAIHLAPSSSLPELVARVEKLSQGITPQPDPGALGGRSEKPSFRA